MKTDTDILQLWNSYSQQLQKVIKVNQDQAVSLLQLRLSHNLRKMRPIKWLGILGGVIWIGLGIAVLNYVLRSARETGQPVNYYFVLSYGLQLAFTAWATVLYVYQLILIHQVQLDTPVIQAQRLINQLRVSHIWVPRILLLQLPLWTTFYLRPEMVASFSVVGWTFQLLTMGIFCYASWWFYTHIRYENIEKKWFRNLFGDKEWTILETAREQLKNIDHLQNEETII